MEKISQKDIEWLLRPGKEFSFKELPREEQVRRLSRRRKISRIFLWSSLVVALGIIPFFVLIRTSVYLNLAQGWNGWFSLIGGISVTVALLLIYLLILSRRIENKKLVVKYGLGGIGILVGGFCIYGLMYLSSVNAKSEDIRQVYRSLHPILRVAVATTTLAEDGLVITDIGRTRADYAQMGLPVNEASLHFEQESGYVHAIDLRTKGHTGIRNFLLRQSLNAMGFSTLRHVGTADHLHVALPVKE